MKPATFVFHLVAAPLCAFGALVLAFSMYQTIADISLDGTCRAVAAQLVTHSDDPQDNDFAAPEVVLNWTMNACECFSLLAAC